MKLICFSHAGGLSYYYTFLKKADFEGVDDMILYEYPLRAAKSKVPHFKSFDECADQIAEELQHGILREGAEDYMFFGHSFGAFVAYETAKLLQERYENPPKLVMISGQKPPCVVDPAHYKCCEEEGVAFLKKLGGLPEHLWNHTEAMQYFTNLCIADLRVLQTYNPGRELPERKLPAGVVLYGKEDIEFASEDLVWWKGYFENCYEIKEFEGGHFYLSDRKDELIAYLRGCIRKALREAAHTAA